MKREFAFGTLLALALGVGAAAQSAGQAYPSGQDKDKDKDTVTVTGCLVPGPAAAVGTSGTTATPSAAAGFMLINASKDGAAAATTTAGTSGTTAETAPAAAGKSYTLIGGDPSDLQKWANSKVEIKGTVDNNASPSPSTTMTGTTAGASPSQAAQRLHVTSVKQIASSCSGE